MWVRQQRKSEWVSSRCRGQTVNYSIKSSYLLFYPSLCRFHSVSGHSHILHYKNRDLNRVKVRISWNDQSAHLIIDRIVLLTTNMINLLIKRCCYIQDTHMYQQNRKWSLFTIKKRKHVCVCVCLCVCLCAFVWRLLKLQLNSVFLRYKRNLFFC